MLLERVGGRGEWWWWRCWEWDIMCYVFLGGIFFFGCIVWVFVSSVFLFYFNEWKIFWKCSFSVCDGCMIFFWSVYYFMWNVFYGGVMLVVFGS